MFVAALLLRDSQSFFFPEGSGESGLSYVKAGKMLNVVQVPARYNLSLEEFEREFASRSLPVILRGAADHWPMVQWSDTRAGAVPSQRVSPFFHPSMRLLWPPASALFSALAATRASPGVWTLEHVKALRSIRLFCPF